MPINQSSKNSRIRLPPGFRFRPSEEELVGFYLASQLLNIARNGTYLSEVDVSGKSPYDLAGTSEDVEDTYFYSKIPSILKTAKGFWKAIQSTPLQKGNGSISTLPAVKTTYVFVEAVGKKKKRTRWIMFEHRFVENNCLKFRSDFGVYHLLMVGSQQTSPSPLPRPCTRAVLKPIDSRTPATVAPELSCSNSSSNTLSLSDRVVDECMSERKRSFIEEIGESSNDSDFSSHKRQYKFDVKQEENANDEDGHKFLTEEILSNVGV